MDERTSRRTALRTVAGLSVTALAGCSQGGSDPLETGSPESTDGPETPTETATPRPLPSDPEPSKWPQRRFDARQRGHKPGATGPTDGVTEAWAAEMPEHQEPRGTPVVGSETVYATSGATAGSSSVSTDVGAVHALDPGDGSERWRTDVDGFAPSGPAVVDGVVYVPADDAGVYALRATDGTVLWHANPEAEVRGPPVVAGGSVYVQGRDGLLALAHDTGAVQWRTERANDVPYAAPVVAEDLVYAYGDEGDTLLAVDAADGTVEWESEELIGTGAEASLAVSGDYLYAATGNALEEYDRRSGSLRTRWRNLESGDPVVADGRIYVGGRTGQLADATVYAYRSGEREPVWTRDTGVDVTGGVTLAGDLLYVTQRDGTLLALDATDGTTRWEHVPREGRFRTPTVLDGRLYASLHTGAAGAVVALAERG